MGHQVQCYWLPDDLKQFLDFVSIDAEITISVRDSDTPTIDDLKDPHTTDVPLSVWNRKLLPALQRREIVRNGGHNYYRIDSSLPVVEVIPSKLVLWNDRAALLQGRIYSSFDHPNRALEKWYKSQERWLRRNFLKCQEKPFGGLIGPAAMHWFENGGVLLPFLVPPVNKQWIDLIEAQKRKTVPGAV